MDQSPIPPSGGNFAPEIADASSLFHEGPAPEAKPAAPVAAEQGDVFEIEERDEPKRPQAQFVPVEDEPRPKKSTPKPIVETKPKLEPSQAVEEVWSRAAEWGTTLGLLAVATMGLALILYGLIWLELYTLAFLMLMAGGSGLVLLSYPILITLERPVRMTPEHAATDYFAALSHHFPHYRRMWLLLSREGRISPSYGSYEGFRAYWRDRLAALKSGRASAFTPLRFQVSDFRAEKSGGKTEIDATFTVSITVRGRSQESPVEVHRVSTTFVKGPDKMWYLDKGTLP